MARWEAGRFVLEGPKLIAEALAAGHPVETIYLDAKSGDPHRELAERCRDAGSTVLEVEPDALSRVLESVAPQPVAAIVPMAHRSLEEVFAPPGPGRHPLTLVCVGLQDPGNAGTVLRSAAASGAGGVVFCAGGVDVYGPKAVRATAGAIFSVPVAAYPEPLETVEVAAESGRSVWATLPAAGVSPDAVDLASPCALVLGGEARGLPDELKDRIHGRLTIPMHKGSESINVAMAATVLCFEAARQRRAGEEA